LIIRNLLIPLCRFKSQKREKLPNRLTGVRGGYAEGVSERESPMYRIKNGKFAGRTMEQAILRNAPALYRIGAWAQSQADEKPNLRPFVREFRRLRKLLSRAQCKARCSESGCRRRARWMTFEEATVGGYLPCPTLWCSKHEPSDYQWITEKMPISLDAMSLFKELKYKKIFCKEIMRAWGIEKGTNVTEKFAHRFFADLSNS
jgi:hypothetical protein